MCLNPSEAWFTEKVLILFGIFRRTGIEPMSIAWKAAVLRLHQWCSSNPIWTDENSRLLNSCVTSISGKFLSTLKVLRRTRIEPMPKAWKATMLPLHQRCLATRTWKKENRGTDNASVWNDDGKSLLTLTFSHRTGIEPFSIPWKVIILPLHQRCSSTQTWTVENNLDLNPSEARFSWNFLIRLGLLRHAGLKTMSIAWRGVVLPLHQWCSSITTLEKENIRVV